MDAKLPQTDALCDWCQAPTDWLQNPVACQCLISRTFPAAMSFIGKERHHIVL
jgi:hypothetical protein